MIKEYLSSISGDCEQCGCSEHLHYDEDGTLICSDCIFENECDVENQKERNRNYDEWRLRAE